MYMYTNQCVDMNEIVTMCVPIVCPNKQIKGIAILITYIIYCMPKYVCFSYVCVRKCHAVYVIIKYFTKYMYFSVKVSFKSV